MLLLRLFPIKAEPFEGEHNFKINNSQEIKGVVSYLFLTKKCWGKKKMMLFLQILFHSRRIEENQVELEWIRSTGQPLPINITDNKVGIFSFMTLSLFSLSFYSPHILFFCLRTGFHLVHSSSFKRNTQLITLLPPPPLIQWRLKERKIRCNRRKCEKERKTKLGGKKKKGNK